MKVRDVFLVLTALIFGLTAPLCANAQDKKPLKVGAIFSVTGKWSALGDPENNTAVMIVEAINKTGGVNGFPLEIIVQDDLSLENKALADVEKLIKAGQGLGNYRAERKRQQPCDKAHLRKGKGTDGLLRCCSGNCNPA